MVAAGQGDSLVTVFWNLENFFDYFDNGGGESDAQFSSYGARRWTKKRFYAKCDAIAKSVMWIGERYGRMPDVIGLAEVENRGVLTKLLNYSLLRKYGYDIVHRDSDDRRGIDVALLYRKSSMSCVSETFIKPVINGVKFPTRDILHACMRFSDGSDVDFIVNHHPSKYGGEKESEIKRYAAMEALRNICDSLGRDNVIAMGDFNDTPEDNSIRVTLGAKPLIEPFCNDSLYNMLYSFVGNPYIGTHKHQSQWSVLDQIIVSGNLLNTGLLNPNSAYIFRADFLLEEDKRNMNVRPKRTYNGLRYQEGYSDHLPVVLELF